MFKQEGNSKSAERCSTANDALVDGMGSMAAEIKKSFVNMFPDWLVDLFGGKTVAKTAAKKTTKTVKKVAKKAPKLK